MSTTQSAAFHRMIWRWHFWAGLIVAPFLLILSATGATYLFDEELNDALYPELRLVAASSERVPVSAMLRAALAAHPGAVSRIDVPAAPDRSAVAHVAPNRGAALRVYVNPHDGAVLGALRYDRTLVGMADAIHGSLMIGRFGDMVVELAASWALVLLGTGLILWWPRGRWRASGTLWPRLGGRGRRGWRDLHGPVGIWTAGLIAFLIITGLPWASIEGSALQRVSAAWGVGYPSSFRTHNTPESVLTKDALDEVPWTLEAAPMPQSAAMVGGPEDRPAASRHAGHAGHEAPPPTADASAIAGVDGVVERVAAMGLTGGFRLFLPGTPTGVYTVLTYPDRPEGQRTLYFDRYSGRSIGPEVRFADYGAVGKAIELGVAIHMGNYFGRANQLLMLVPCVGIWVLTISGVAMWWKRRPKGRIAAPPRLSGARWKGAAAVLLGAAIAMPLFGASLLAIGVIDQLVRRTPTILGRRSSDRAGSMR